MPKRFRYFTYIITNEYNTVLYTGMTNDLERRVKEHRNKRNKGFTEKYNCSKLVWFEFTSTPMGAINREKEIKKWRRSKKIALIESMNPHWLDLAEGWPE